MCRRRRVAVAFGSHLRMARKYASRRLGAALIVVVYYMIDVELKKATDLNSLCSSLVVRTI
jgi:hypothetical protein